MIWTDTILEYFERDVTHIARRAAGGYEWEKAM